MSVIRHALELTFRDLGVFLAAVVFASVAFVVVILAIGEILKRAERHHDAIVARARAGAEVRQAEARRRVQERHRSEMRSYNARPTADERFGRVA